MKTFRIIFLTLLITLGCMKPASMVDAKTVETWIDPTYVAYCEELGAEYAICPELLVALIESESSGQPNVVSKTGCVGLGQINPTYSRFTREQLFDPYTNITAICDFITTFAEEYGEVSNVLMAYKHGPYSKTYKKYEETGVMSSLVEKVLIRSAELESYHEEISYEKNYKKLGA